MHIQQLLLLLFLSWDYEVKKILVSLGVGRIGTQGTVLKINKSHCAGGTHCFLLVTTTIASFFIWPVRDAENVRRKHHGKCVKCAEIVREIVDLIQGVDSQEMISSVRTKN